MKLLYFLTFLALTTSVLGLTAPQREFSERGSLRIVRGAFRDGATRATIDTDNNIK
jgi:hypothetical protein